MASKCESMWPFSKHSRPNNGFLDLTQITVARSLADEARAHLREVGRSGYEGFALWVGVRANQDFVVKQTIIPAQIGHRSPDGVCVSVGPEELHRINVWLYENGMSLIAQLHSHPGDAYHSDTDDTFPIATTVGALSLVLPNYAVRPFALEECAIYRLMPNAGWMHISKIAAARLIKIID